ncbi:MAG: NAD(+) diphosphatase [Pseudomonadota bacterium]
MTEIKRVTFAAGSGLLDRAAHLRDVSDDLLRHRRAALLPLFHGQILIDTSTSETRLGWVPPMQNYLDEATEEPVFLGLSRDTPCFAADFSAMDDKLAEDQFCEEAEFMDLRAVAGRLGPASAAIAATARGMVSWHLANPFCPQCSARTLPIAGGWQRVCSSCGAKHYPRTDPVVIMLILDDDQALLVRKPTSAAGLYSLSAGFMEPGETVEDAVRRETREETGIEVGEVGYLGSQPWPFPGNLMIGCVGVAETTEIKPNPDEIEDAQWISRAKMQVILEGQHPRMNAPGLDAIARAILTDWVEDRVRMP